VLGKLARQHDPNLLVGFDQADDAGVYQISPELALVQTVDFFTPIVDDAYTFGQIAAVNALSDVYAMGGRPLSSLAMVCFPEKGDLEVLEQILAGGLSKMVEAQCTVAGGHSIRDPEIKFGYAVTGSIHPDRIWKNSTALAGDVLMFTKRIGTGVITTAIKRGTASEAHTAGAIESMLTLNRDAALALENLEVHAVTDVTGFGLLGHAREMVMGSRVNLEITQYCIRFLPGAEEYAHAGAIPSGLVNNREFVESCVFASPNVDAVRKTLLYDPQTAGGLLISVAEAHAEALVSALRGAGVEHAASIGVVLSRISKDTPLIQVT